MAVRRSLVWRGKSDFGTLFAAEAFDVAARELSGSACLEVQSRVSGGVLPVRNCLRDSLRGASFCFSVEWEAVGGVCVGEGVDVMVAADRHGEWAGGVDSDVLEGTRSDGVGKGDVRGGGHLFFDAWHAGKSERVCF